MVQYQKLKETKRFYVYRRYDGRILFVPRHILEDEDEHTEENL